MKQRLCVVLKRIVQIHMSQPDMFKLNVCLVFCTLLESAVVEPCLSCVPNCAGLEVLDESSVMRPACVSSLNSGWVLPGGLLVLLDLW